MFKHFSEIFVFFARLETTVLLPLKNLEMPFLDWYISFTWACVSVDLSFTYFRLIGHFTLEFTHHPLSLGFCTGKTISPVRGFMAYSS